MFCNKCGCKINPGSSFCSKCGNPLQQEADNPSPSGNIERDEARHSGPAGKPRKGLVVLLVAAGVVVALAAVAVLFISSRSIQGEWYNRSLGTVIDFKSNGGLLVRKGGGTSSGEYSYDIIKGSGSLLIDGQSSSFEKDHDKLNVAGPMGNTVYYRAGGDTDVYEIVMGSAQQNSPAATATPAPVPTQDETARNQDDSLTEEEPAEDEPADEDESNDEGSGDINFEAMEPLLPDSIANDNAQGLVAAFNMSGTWISSSSRSAKITFDGNSYDYYFDGEVTDYGTYTYDHSTCSGVMYSDRNSASYSFTVEEDNDRLYVSSREYYREN